MIFAKRLAALFLLMASTVAVQAHPHVFIDAKTRFVIDANGNLAALNITWTYDAFTTLTFFDLLDLDNDNDGVLSDADLARVVKAQTIWPDNFNGDTYLEALDGQVPLGRPMNGSATLDDMRLSVSFELPLQTPRPAKAGMVLRLYDPAYYYAYAVLETTATQDCAADLNRFEPGGATSALQKQLARLSREETPDQKDVGRLFADVIVLTCA